MYRRYYLAEVVLILLLSHGGWNGPSVTLHSCTSESSSLIRNVVQKQLLPVVSRYGVALPLECPLHPQRDMFWWLRDMPVGTEDIECPVCGQRFHCENKFVTHWDTSHARNQGLSEGKVCLDEYCDVFRCDVLRQKEALAYIQRQNPAKLIAQKSPIESNPHQNECLKESMLPIRNKCRTLIRQCTIGIITHLSSSDFQNLEEELDHSICSYLTCDKYWDDFDSQPHYLLPIVCAVITLLIIMSLCFCYYGVWLLAQNHAAKNFQFCCKCNRRKYVPKQNRAHFSYRPLYTHIVTQNGGTLGYASEQ